MLRVLLLGCSLLLAGCGAAAASTPPAVSAEPQAIEAIQAPVASEQAPEPPAPREEKPAEAGVDPGSPADEGEGVSDGEAQNVRAGKVPRDAMVAMLDRGIARFLQQVDTRPLEAEGRFVGWKLLEFFPNDDRFVGCGIEKGDTVLRVNGRSIERPESFKTVWDSLYTARELKVLLLRAGRLYEVRYEIE